MRAERGNSGPKRQRGGSLTAFLALQTQSDFLGDLGLLVEDGLGLIAKNQQVFGESTTRAAARAHR